MRFARWMFGAAAVYGVVSLLPLYALEASIARLAPPALTHVEFYYGFIGVALAWQWLFGVIASDPQRFRPAMPCAIAEKLGFGGAIVALSAAGRVSDATLWLGVVDLAFGAGFAVAFVATARRRAGAHERTSARDSAAAPASPP